MNTFITSSPDPYQLLLENYVSILEKTNNQLGLWLVIGDWITAILSVIVGVIAILVGYAIWKNSYEQKKQFEAFLRTQEITLREAVEKTDKRFEESKSALDQLIIEQENKLSSATTENKKEIEKAITNLKKEKATLGVGYMTGPNVVYTSAASQGIGLYDSVGVTDRLQASSQMVGMTAPIYRTVKYCSSCGAVALNSTKQCHCGHLYV